VGTGEPIHRPNPRAGPQPRTALVVLDPSFLTQVGTGAKNTLPLFFVDNRGELFLKHPSFALHKVELEGGKVGGVAGQIRRFVFVELGAEAK